MTRGYTLDFTLQNKSTSHAYVAELKCWPEYENQWYLRLDVPEQITRIKEPPAFTRLLTIAKEPAAYGVYVGGKPIHMQGAILVWCAHTEVGRSEAMAKLGFADVLSLEMMLEDLRAWQPDGWKARIQQLKQWSDELFAYLS